MRSSVKKYWILLLAELLLLLLSMPGCFAGEELVYKAKKGAEGEYFSLSPGVYRFRAQANVPVGGYIALRAEAADGSFQAFRCNGTTMEEGQGETSFEIYVLDRVEKAYIVCEIADVEGIVLESAEIYSTNLGGRICCFCILVGSMLVNALLYYREKVLAGEISRQSQLAFWMLVLCVALSYFPYATDYYNFGADSGFHMLRIEGLKETLISGGQFPVRVQSHWLRGHGYAVSTFYADFFLFIPVLLRLIGFSLMTSYKIFVLLVMAATAAVAYYSLKKCTKSDSAALLGSVIYVLAPYRIYNVYNRGAVGEYVAMIFLPLVISGMYRLYTEQIDDKEYTKAKIPLILGLSGILQSHLLTCEMAVFGILLVCVALWKKTLRKQTFFQLLQAAVICLLLNCWFWLPLIQMMGMDKFWLHDLVNESIQEKGTLLAGIFQIWPNMGGFQTGMYNCEPIQAGIASLVLLGAYWILYIRKMIQGKSRKDNTRQKNPYDKAASFFGAGSVLMVLLSTNIFPWDFLAEIPGFRFFVTALQFPTRLLSPASAFCAVFAAFFLLWVQEEEGMGGEIVRGMYLVILFLAVFSGVYHVNNIAYVTSPVRLYNGENLGTLGVINGEYLLEGTVLEEYQFHDPVAEEGLEWDDYTKNGVNISLSVINHTDRQLYLELPLIGYKGYGLDCGEKTGEVPVIAERAQNGHGDLRIAVPAGYSGEIRISYKGFASYRVAEIVSLVALLGIGIGLALRHNTAFARQGALRYRNRK